MVPDVAAAVAPIVQRNLAGMGDPSETFPLLAIEEASSYHLKDHIVLPRTALLTCERDGQRGAVFVDTLAGEDTVGPATAILSYAWKYPFVLVAGALGNWCESNDLDPRREYVWIDVLCWNQHGRLGDPVAEWETRVVAIGHQLTMLHPWNNPVYTTRAWCIFELWFAIGLGKRDCDLEIILAPEDRTAFQLAVNQKGYGVVDGALSNIASESAEAFSPDDLAAIKAKVTSAVGGFDRLNETIRGHLSRWFQSQGGIRGARRTSSTTFLRNLSPGGPGVGGAPAASSGGNPRRARSGGAVMRAVVGQTRLGETSFA